MREVRLIEDYDSSDFVEFETDVTQNVKKRPARSRQEQVRIRREVEDVLSEQRMRQSFDDPWGE